MARPLRIEYPGALYHITSRGNARQDIFFDDIDRNRFLSILARVVHDYNWIVYAYCLMSNHYHLLVETADATLSAGMRQFNGIYTQGVNRRHGRTGHVFQGRFKGILVQKESHLLELCRYIVLNPLKAGMVDSADGWKWSSFRATAGADPTPEFLSTEWILAQFAQSRVKAQKLYRQFVLAGITKESVWKDLKAGTFLGSISFVDTIKDSLREISLEVPRRQRHIGRPPLAELFPHGNEEKDRQLAVARGHGYTLQEIGEHLALHYATVSRRAKRFREQETLQRKKSAKNKT
jgi:REP element-mobilizing transposase RayT